MKKGLACFLALCALSVGAQAEEANGVYESTAKGFGGDVTVSVTLEGGGIRRCEGGRQPGERRRHWRPRD